MNKISISQLQDMLVFAYKHFSHHVTQINNLNVFPVPDCDTGTNMFLTFTNGIKLIENKQFKTVQDLTHDFAKGLLLGARGNSGVIFSQIFNGISLNLQDLTPLQELTIPDLCDGLARGVEEAYSSVLKPIEGTILTVIRETSTAINKEKPKKLDELLNLLVEESHKSLENTPNLLPLLKKAEVVDSGGMGLHQVFVGFKKYFAGEKVELASGNISHQTENAKNHNVDNQQFGYCSEGILELKDTSIFDKKSVEIDLEKKGCDSIVIVTMDNLLKFHAHTFKPGELITYFQKMGEFHKLKIENMQYQVEEHQIIDLSNASKETSKKERSKFATIAVGSGEGVYSIAKELGIDYLISGGATNNPSLQDFIVAIDAINAENVIIFPNDSNIYLVALQAQKHSANSNIKIIKTTNMVESFIISQYIDKEAPFDDIAKECEEILEKIQYCIITTAAKNIVLDNVRIRKDDYLVMVKPKKIIASCKSFNKALEIIANKIIPKNVGMVSFLMGQELDLEQTDSIEKMAKEMNIEHEILQTNQPVYFTIIGFEVNNA